MAAPPPLLQMSWQPHLRRRKGGPPLGLRNLGNSCYLNSVLQCLTYTPPLANFCLQYLHSSLCEKQQQQQQKRDCPFCILEKRIARSLNLEAPNDAPSKIGSCLRLFAEHFQWGRQEDAHEFLRYVIDACHNTCLKLVKASGNGGGSTVVKDIFGGALLSQVKCLSCGCESNKMDEIMDISLDLVQSKSLNDALRRFFQPELLDGDNKYSCSSCKKLSSAKKQMFILQAPNVLVIQLKRFEGINGGKINKDISFEEVLLLPDFMSKGSQDPKPEYNLIGSIVHSGYSPESGHYYAYVKDPFGRWYCCNDSYVSLSSTQEVLSEKVYILFYLRVNQGPKCVKTIMPSVDQKLPESNGKGHLEIPKSCSLPNSNGKGALHSERNVSTALKNGKMATFSQIKFGNLKSLQKKSYSLQENGCLKIYNDAKNDEGSSIKQLPLSEKSSALSTSMAAKNSSAPYSKDKPIGTGQADISSSDGQLTEANVSPVIENNMKTSQGKAVDSVKSEADAQNMLGVGSGSGFHECRSYDSNKKRKSNVENSTIPFSHCSVSDVVKEDVSYGSYSIFADKLSSEGFENLKKRLSEKARTELQSCGWIDEVHNSMRVRKRLCAKTTGSPPDHTDLRTMLVADAKKIFTSRIPQDLKEDLIGCLRRSFRRGKHVGV